MTNIVNNGTGVPYFMKETDDMRRFFIDDLVRYGVLSGSKKAHSNSVPDAYMSPCVLTKRTACVLQKAFTIGYLSRRFHWNHLYCGKICLRSCSNLFVHSYMLASNDINHMNDSSILKHPPRMRVFPTKVPIDESKEQVEEIRGGGESSLVL